MIPATGPAAAQERVAAAHWYARTPLAHGVTLLSEIHIDPFYRCNIWHVRGRDGCLLVDSGSGVVSLAAQMPWLRDTPLLAVASHAHFDHIGCHHEFPDRACHRAEADILAHPTRDATLATRYARLAMFERLPPGGFDEQAYAVAAAPANRLLEAGDTIDLGDRHFAVLHVPGHSPGSIALWEAATGMLIAGDAVYDGPLVDDAYHSDVECYLDTMRRLRELPVSIVHAGHYPSFGAQRLHQLIDDYIRLRQVPGCPADRAAPPPSPAQ